MLVEAPGGKRHLIAIEAASALQARQLVASDWGDENVREVKGAR